MNIHTIGAARTTSSTDNVVPFSYRMKDGGMELPDGTLIVDCGQGDGTEQELFIERDSLPALILCLRTLEAAHKG